METFNDIGHLMRFLSNKDTSCPDTIPETYVERMAAALDDDAYGRRHIEKILRGDVTFTENSDPIDGEGRDQKVQELVDSFKRWRLSERWLFLSAATSDEERKQRNFEFDNFKKETGIPAEDIATASVDDINQLYQIISVFIDRNKVYDRPMNILVLGHGSLKCTTNFKGKLIVGNGQLAMLVNIEPYGSTKISVDNHDVINMIYEITRDHQIGESNRVNLCLFYCYAHAKDTGKVFKNFKVITYKDGKNPGSLRYTVKGELVDSENTALPWFAEERDKQENGEPHNLYPVVQPASVKKSAPETKTTFQPSSDGQSGGEEDLSSIYLTCHDQKFSHEVNLSGKLEAWEPPQRNLSVEDPNKECAFDSAEGANDDPAEGSDTERENKVVSGRAGGEKTEEEFHSIDDFDEVKGGEREVGDEFHSIDCCGEMNEAGEKGKKDKKGVEVCSDRQQGARSGSERDVSECLHDFQKGSMVITHQVDELPAVEVTSGNPVKDDGRQGWVSRTWGRVRNGFGYLNWYY